MNPPTLSDPPLTAVLAAVTSVRGNSPFVALRNADTLPDRLDGRDLDVSVAPGVSLRDAARFVIQHGERAGWQVVVDSRRHHMAAVTLFHPETRETLHFDLFKGITHLSNPLFTVEELWEESEVVNDVRRLSHRMEVLATVVHRTVFGGTLNKQKYVEQLAEFVSDPRNRSWLAARVSRVLGPEFAVELTTPERVRELTRFGADRSARARKTFLSRRARRAPFSFAWDTVRYFAGQVGSMLFPPGFVGQPGDRVPALGSELLTLELACALSAYGFYVPSTRSRAEQIQTVNAPRFADMLKERWDYWGPLREWAPSVFLWFLAKRAAVVVVDRLPPLLALLRGSRVLCPRWLGREST